jgi:hypothetical protein
MGKRGEGTAKDAAAVRAAGPSAATPWGKAAVVQEVRVDQRVGDKRFASILQLLENERGDSFVRFAYTTGGVARRGPVTLRARDVERLRTAVPPESALAVLFGWSGGDA